MLLSSDPYLSGMMDVYRPALPPSLHRMSSVERMIPALLPSRKTRFEQSPSVQSAKSPASVNPLPIELKEDILKNLPPSTHAQLSLVDHAWCDATRFFPQRLTLKDPTDLQRALATFPRATDITFEHCHTLRGPDLESLARHYPHIQQLRIHDAPQLTNKDFSFIATMKDLQFLSISRTPMNDEIFQGISKLDSLTHLHISGEHITGIRLDQLSPLTRLQSLHLGYTGVSSHTLALLPPLSTLKELSLEGCRGLKNADLLELTRFPMLENLNLDDIPIADHGIANLARLKHLHTLSLAKSACTKRGLESIGNCQALTNLDLSRSTNFEAEDVAHLKKLHDLQFLDLGACEIDDNAVDHLLELSKLQRLSLVGSTMSNANFSRLKALHNLRYLILSATDVSNSGVLPLLHSEQLRYLALHDCPYIDVAALAAQSRHLPDLWIDVRPLEG